MKDKKIFNPKPGQIDYTSVRWAPAINCVVKHADKILIVKRSLDMKFYPGWWNGLGGFLDDDKSLEEKVKEEIMEEIGIEEKDIISIKLGEIFDYDDPELGKTWIIHPALVEVKTNKVVLDWEADDYRWARPDELAGFEITPSFKKIIAGFFHLPETPQS